MTRTEERLADALRAKAATVRTERRRPLPEPRRPLPEPRHRAWNWLAPLAAAAAVVLIAVTATLVTRAQTTPAARTAPATSQASAPASATPKYYAEFWIRNQVMIRSTATGKVVRWVPEPAGVLGMDLAAGPDGRTFYMGTASPQSVNAIYSFRLTQSGAVTPMRKINGGAIGPAGDMVSGLAVSPDGTELAVAVAGARYDRAGTLVVIDLRTGAHHVWQGGLPLWENHTYTGVNIQDLSWSGDQTLDFVTSWCPNAAWAYCGPGTAQVRTLSVASGGGSLTASTVVLGSLARFPEITGMVAGQQGHLTIMQVSGAVQPPGSQAPGSQAPGSLAVGSEATVTVEQISAADGSVLSVLYRRRFAVEPDLYAWLTADPSGQHVLLWIDDSLHGWLGQGVLRPLQAGALPGAVW
jgi:hypothetical protein